MNIRSLFSSRALSSLAVGTVAALAVASLGCSASAEDVDAQEASAQPPIGEARQELIKGGTGSNTGGTCVDKWQNCYVNCGVKHPEGDMRDGCEDSCDAAYRLCTIFGSGGGIIRY